MGRAYPRRSPPVKSKVGRRNSLSQADTDCSEQLLGPIGVDLDSAVQAVNQLGSKTTIFPFTQRVRTLAMCTRESAAAVSEPDQQHAAGTKDSEVVPGVVPGGEDGGALEEDAAEPGKIFDLTGTYPGEFVTGKSPAIFAGRSSGKIFCAMSHGSLSFSLIVGIRFTRVLRR